MRDREPTARSRELGAELRLLRKRDGRSSPQIADELGWSASRISRLESGKRGVSEIDLAMLLAIYGVRGEEADRLVAMDRMPYQRSWLRTNREQPNVPRMLIIHERTTKAITEYEPLLVPHLLQTEGYARAMLNASKLLPDHVVNQKLEALCSRQVIFDREPPPRLTFFISEHALLSWIGDVDTIADQVRSLIIMAGHPACTIRLLPAAKAHVGLFGAPFRLLEYKEFRPVVHSQSQAATLFLEEPDDVNAYRAVLNRIDELALDIVQSTHALDKLANRLEEAAATSRAGATESRALLD